MKTLKISHLRDKSNNGEEPEKVKANKILRYVLVIFMLFYIMLLSSCYVMGPGPEGHRGHEGHGHEEHHGHDR